MAGLQQPQIEQLTAALRKAEGERSGLAETIVARDAFIETLGAEKVALRGRVTELEGMVRDRQKQLDGLAAELAASRKGIADRDARLKESEAAAAALRQRVTELQARAATDPQLRSEVEGVRLRNAALESELARRNVDLAQLASDFAAIQLRYNALKPEAESLGRQAAALQKEKDALAQELAALNARTRAAFSAGGLADCLSKTIDRFNEQVNASTPTVNYVINAMDVELKALVGKTDANELILAAPPLGASGEQALSSVRLSIRSVPKE